MDSLHLAIALTPLAIYLLVIGVLNTRPRPTVMAGHRDAALLAAGISGFYVAGPLELFLPEAAAYRFGPVAWLLMLAMFVLVSALVILTRRPRIVIYQTTKTQVQQALTAVVNKLDLEVVTTGGNLLIPRMGVQLHLDDESPLNHVQLVSIGGEQDLANWQRLQAGLADELKGVRTTPAGLGRTFVALAATLIAALVFAFARDNQAMAHALREMLRL